MRSRGRHRGGPASCRHTRVWTPPVWPAVGLALTYVSGWAGLVPIVGVVLLGLVPIDAVSTEQYDELG